MTQEQVTELNYVEPADFDNNVLKVIDAILQSNDPLSKACNVGRCNSIMTNFAQGSAWPLDSAYVPIDMLIAAFNQLQLNDGNESEDNSSEDVDSALYLPSIVNHFLPAEKLRTILHMPVQQVSEEALKVPSVELTKLPQWSVLVNLMGHGHKYLGNELAGVSFTRAFFGKLQAADGEEVPEELQATSSVKGEPPSVMNLFSTVLFFTNGKFDLGPTITIDDTTTIGDAIESTSALLNEQLTDTTWLSGENPEELKAMAAENNKLIKLLASYVVYILKHKDEVKDKDGNATSFAPNPQPDTRMSPNDPFDLIANAKSDTLLYLD